MADVELNCAFSHVVFFYCEGDDGLFVDAETAVVTAVVELVVVAMAEN